MQNTTHLNVDSLHLFSLLDVPRAWLCCYSRAGSLPLLSPSACTQVPVGTFGVCLLRVPLRQTLMCMRLIIWKSTIQHYRLIPPQRIFLHILTTKGINSCIYTPYPIIVWTGDNWSMRIILLLPLMAENGVEIPLRAGRFCSSGRMDRILGTPWKILRIPNQSSFQSIHVRSGYWRNLHLYGGYLMLWIINNTSYLKSISSTGRDPQVLYSNAKVHSWIQTYRQRERKYFVVVFDM